MNRNEIRLNNNEQGIEVYAGETKEYRGNLVITPERYGAIYNRSGFEIASFVTNGYPIEGQDYLVISQDEANRFQQSSGCQMVLYPEGFMLLGQGAVNYLEANLPGIPRHWNNENLLPLAPKKVKYPSPIKDTQLVQVREDGLIDAREIHSFIGSKKKFSDWMKHRIEHFGFEEGIDFQKESLLPQKVKQTRGGHNQLNYYVTMDMAKELGMIERNDRGRMIRNYFIRSDEKRRELEHSPKNTEGLLEQAVRKMTKEAVDEQFGALVELITEVERRLPKEPIEATVRSILNNTKICFG